MIHTILHNNSCSKATTYTRCTKVALRGHYSALSGDEPFAAPCRPPPSFRSRSGTRP